MSKSYIDLVREIRVPSIEKVESRPGTEDIPPDCFNDYYEQISKNILYRGRGLSELHINRSNRELTVIAGFKPGARFHIGHISFAERISFFQRNGASVYLVISNLENLLRKGEESDISNSNNFEFLSYLYSSADIDPNKINLIDDRDKKVYELGLRLSRHCTSNQLEKIFGDDDGAVSKRIFPFFVAASYLIPQDIYPKNNNLILASPLHDPLISFTRRIARKEGYDKPAAIYAKGVPDMTGKALMRSGNSKNTIYLDEPLFEIIKKLRKTSSGGREYEQHRLIGGDIANCPFFKINCFVSNLNDLDFMINGCTKGVLCKDCKTLSLERIIQRITGIKERAENVNLDIP